MHVIDVNTVIGKRVEDDPHFTPEALLRELDAHDVAAAFCYAQQGVDYDYRAGNVEALKASRACPGLLPVAVLDPRDSIGWEAELERCLEAGVRAVRFFPAAQYWSVESMALQRILRRLKGTGMVLMFSSVDSPTGWELPGQIARRTADLGLAVILIDTYYANMTEVMAVMREYPHVYAETNWLATVGGIDVMAGEVGVERLVYGSGAPARPIQKALNQVLESDLPEADKALILGGNAARLLRIPADQLAGRPEFRVFSPFCFGEEIIDVHSHLGFWSRPIPHEDYNPAGMLRRMQRFGIRCSVVSSYESMRYDIAAGNRGIASAIAGHPELRGYVEVNPHQLELSCAEMDRYYRLPNFAGAEIELTHIPCPTGSAQVKKLMAEIARRGKPVLFMPASGADAEAERDLGRMNPGLTIIHAHGFSPEWAATVADTPNICVEFCLSRPSHHAVRAALDILGPERVLFGSDQTLLSVGAAIGLYRDALRTPEERRLVLHANARRIFGL